MNIPTGDDEIGQLGKSLSKLSVYFQRQFNKNQLLSRITIECNLNMSVNDVLNHIYKSFNKFIPFDRISLALLENEDHVLKIHWAQSNYEPLKPPVGASTPMSDSNLQQIIGTEGPLIINDLNDFTKKFRQSDSIKLIFGEGVRSNLTCPLVASGKLIGFVFFSSRKKNTYKQLDQDLFLQIANQLSAIVEKNKLYKMAVLNKQLIEQKKELEQRVTHDALTGLLNRPAIFEIFHKQIARAKRGGFGVAVIMIDIDHFKEVNDNCGHMVGDAVLCEIADRLLELARAHEHVGRFGGEEFLVILSPCDKDGALKAAERLRAAVADKVINVEGEPIPVTISLGVAISSELDTLDESTLLCKADEALYAAKDNGRNRIETAS